MATLSKAIDENVRQGGNIYICILKPHFKKADGKEQRLLSWKVGVILKSQ